jgi:hypothetical protein
LNSYLPNPDKPEPNRFEDKKIDCVSEFSARQNTNFRIKKLEGIERDLWLQKERRVGKK